MHLLLLLACENAQPEPAPTSGEDDSAQPSDTGLPDDSAPDSGVPPIDTADSSDTDASACGDCDDGDACTLDTCDENSATCLHELPTAVGPGLYDMATLTDPTTLDIEVLSTEVVYEGLTKLHLSEIRYTSFEVRDCEVNTIRIEAFVARPDSADSGNPAPGLVVAHGLGGSASAGTATGPAEDFGYVTLAYSGPGQGLSEGEGSHPDHLFDTVPDARASWFWEHSVAAIRGLSVLENWEAVDSARLGMTGYSGGAVATLMVNGVDARVSAAVAVSASGYLDSAARATPNHGWEADLLEAMTPALTPDSPEWAAYDAALDPKHFLATAQGPTLMIVGAQDQFFPIDSATDTFADLQATGGEHRLLEIKDWDHGWYALFTSDTAAPMADGSLAYWFRHVWGIDHAEVMPQPTMVGITPWTCYDPTYWWITWSCAVVGVQVDTGYDVGDVEFHFSVDNAFTFASWNLQDQGGGLYAAEVGTFDANVWNDGNTVYFAEVELTDGWLGTPFYVTTKPNIPAGFSPYIIPIAGPLP